ncbi:MAG: glycine cleavage system aminomethyltransferase GcvT [Planctomycetes bacterium]|nr:glycine cleavage system aminomethyltransferase GcvT [Planctomycetota bacterium]
MTTATLARTPFHPWSAERGARFVDFAGWEMPMSYGSIIDEHHACRTGAAFFDVSHMGRLRITGRHARKFLDRVCTRLILGMERGQVRYSLVCNERGGVRDDVLVYCYDEDDYMMVVNASNRLKIMEWFRAIKERENLTFSMEDITASTAMAAIQGPKVMELVGTFSREIPTLKRYRFAEKSLMVAKLTVSRTGYTGEDGVELVMGSTVAKFVLPMLLREKDGVAGAVRACGLGSRDSLRTEASMPLYGHEITEEIDPLSAGLGFAVKLDKGAADEREGRFIGQDALEAVAKAGPKHRLVGFEVEGRRAARQGMGIHRGGEHVGHVTSGCLSPTLDKVIAMGYVPSELSAEGTEFEIDLGKARTAARIVKMPFYNPVRAK